MIAIWRACTVGERLTLAILAIGFTIQVIVSMRGWFVWGAVAGVVTGAAAGAAYVSLNRPKGTGL